MANPAETSFNALLHADADVALPDSDAEVIAAILAYGAIYKNGRGVAQVETRLDLLAGLLWCVPRRGPAASRRAGFR